MKKKEIEERLGNEFNIKVSEDEDIPFLFEIPSGSVKCLQQNEYIYQSKSSCLPPFILYQLCAPRKSKEKIKGVILDACAAPGNKTQQLTEYYGNKLIYIFIYIYIYRTYNCNRKR